MKIRLHFIETRLGEPITAIDYLHPHIVIGSISGFYGVLNVSSGKL